MELREQLRAARLSKGLTTEQVAALVGRSQSVISRWENGTATMPAFDVVIRWAEAVGATLRIDVKTDNDPFDGLRSVLSTEEADRMLRAFSAVKKVS